MGVFILIIAFIIFIYRIKLLSDMCEYYSAKNRENKERKIQANNSRRE